MPVGGLRNVNSKLTCISVRNERANSLNGIREIRRLRSRPNARENTFDYEGLARWTLQRAREAEEDIPGLIARHRARSLSLSLPGQDVERGRSRARSQEEEAKDTARGISDLLTRYRSHSRSSSVVTQIRALSLGGQERGRSRVRAEDNMANNNNNNNNNAFPALDTSMAGPNRTTTSPTTSHPGSAANGNGAGPANYMATLPVGHQQDLNFLYNQIQELGTLLRSNREQVNSVTRTAEEVAVSLETFCY